MKDTEDTQTPTTATPTPVAPAPAPTPTPTEEIPEELRDTDDTDTGDDEPAPQRKSHGAGFVIVGLLIALVALAIWIGKEKQDASARQQAAVAAAISEYAAAHTPVICDPCPVVEPNSCRVADAPKLKVKVKRRATVNNAKPAQVVQVVESVVPEATIKAEVRTKPGVHVSVRSETVITTTR